MSLLRSPNKCYGGSQPELSKLSDTGSMADKAQITFRKRKEPEPDFLMKEEFNSLRNEMRSFLTSFSEVQNDSTNKLRQDMSEIKDQLNSIRASTDMVIEEQKCMKIEMEYLKSLCATNEDNIKRLQTQLSVSENYPQFTSQSQMASFTYEDVVAECQERYDKRKNVIIYGISELPSENKNERFEFDKKEVTKILNTVSPNCSEPTRMFRLGNYIPGRNRPIRVCFALEETALMLLRKRGNLKKDISLRSDQTLKQRDHLKRLRDELQQREQSGEVNLTIKYVKGTPKIVMQQSKN